MKSLLQRLVSSTALFSAVLLQAVQPVHGHYGFAVLIANDKPSGWFEYIRPVTYWGPYYDYTGEIQVCGANGTKSGHRTKTAVVEAGSTLGFQVSTGNSNPSEVQPFNPALDTMYHPGPGQAYLSKATGEIEDYVGDGDWFKIGSLVSTNGADWDPTGKSSMNFTIPKTTPPGKYLLRVEQFYILPYFMETQHYINCAQIEVVGPGGGTPGPFIKFPGGYDPKDKGIWLPQALFNPQKPTEILKKYKAPGPAVWTG